MTAEMEITDPEELALLRLYRSYPPELRPAVARLVQDMAEDVPPGEALYPFGLTTGQTEAEARAAADRAMGLKADR
jgi:hypothetical protein